MHDHNKAPIRAGLMSIVLQASFKAHRSAGESSRLRAGTSCIFTCVRDSSCDRESNTSSFLGVLCVCCVLCALPDEFKILF